MDSSRKEPARIYRVTDFFSELEVLLREQEEYAESLVRNPGEDGHEKFISRGINLVTMKVRHLVRNVRRAEDLDVEGSPVAGRSDKALTQKTVDAVLGVLEGRGMVSRMH